MGLRKESDSDNPTTTRSARSGRSIATQVFLAELVIVILVAAIASVIALRANRNQVERFSGEKALAIARSVAALTVVRDAFETDNPSSVIQPIAESVRTSSGADFVVVANHEQVRYSHPDPSKIGERLSTDGGPVLRGKDFIGTERGTLGRSVRGKTPVFDDSGRVIGIVSVGLLIEGVEARSRADLLRLIGYLCAGALVLGGLGAGLVARRVGRQTYSMDAEGIGSLLEHREAILRSVKEGVVAVDLEGRITLTNGEARSLLGLPETSVGQSLHSLGLTPEAIATLTTTSPETDRVIVVSDRLLAANRRPITIRGHERGAIVTLRDRTELDRLHMELAGTKAATDTLRAQAHEFSNQLHTIAGLVALQAYDEVGRFIETAANAHAETDAAVSRRVTEPRVGALLIAKMALARERRITLTLDDRSELERVDDADTGDLLLVIGNLIDNALHAVERDGWVGIEIHQDRLGVRVVVRDSGPGVPADDVDRIFGVGYTTKRAAGHAGLGLVLSRRACEERGGAISVVDGAPTTFEAWLPMKHVSDVSGEPLDGMRLPSRSVRAESVGVLR